MHSDDTILLIDCFSHHYWRAVRELDIFRMREWEQRHITLAQLRILFNVARSPGITANELADILGVTVSTTSGLIAKLVERGLVTKSVATGDRRQLPLDLTEEGRRLTGEVAETNREFMERTAEELGGRLPEVAAALETLALAAGKAREALDLERRDGER